MRLKLFASLLAGLCLLSLIAPAQAQSFRQRRPLRWLGEGFSDGYHRCQPLHDSSYYSPYSQHNSFLYSQTPAYRQFQQQRYQGQWDRPAPEFFGGVPFSIYAAPHQAEAQPAPDAAPHGMKPAPHPQASWQLPTLNGSGQPVQPLRRDPPGRFRQAGFGASSPLESGN